MQVRMVTMAAGPLGVLQAGQVVEVTEAMGAELIAIGAATAVDVETCRPWSMRWRRRLKQRQRSESGNSMIGSWVLVTPPAEEPVTLTEIRIICISAARRRTAC